MEEHTIYRDLPWNEEGVFSDNKGKVFKPKLVNEDEKIAKSNVKSTDEQTADDNTVTSTNDLENDTTNTHSQNSEATAKKE